MARPVRIEFESPAYHAMTRGDHGKSGYRVAMLGRTVRNRREQGTMSGFTARPRAGGVGRPSFAALAFHPSRILSLCALGFCLQGGDKGGDPQGPASSGEG